MTKSQNETMKFESPNGYYSSPYDENNNDSIDSIDDELLNQDSKAIAALEWMRRVLSGMGPVSPDFYGSRNHVRSCFHPNINLDDLRVEVVTGGLTNVSLHIFDSQRINTTNNDKNNNSKSSPSLSDQYPSQVFLKVSRNHPAWSDDCDLPVARVDREFIGGELMYDACPGATAQPLLCESDMFTDDGTKYLVSEFLPPDDYDQYMHQFQQGKVDTLPSQVIGETIATFHASSRSGGGRDVAWNEDTADMLYYDCYKCFTDGWKSWATQDACDLDDKQLKYKALYKKHPEYLECLDQVLNSIFYPSNATAAHVHHDFHILNILVKENAQRRKSNDLVKFVDFEFANWGPIGSDIGTFSACAILYAIMHGCAIEQTGKDADWRGILDAMITMWKSYTRAFLQYADSQSNRERVLLELEAIAHESIAWTGFIMCKYFCAQLFHLCTESLLRAPDGLFEHLDGLRSRDSEMDGREYLRSTVVEFAHKLLAKGCFKEIIVDQDSARPGDFMEKMIVSISHEVEALVLMMQKDLGSMEKEGDEIIRISRLDKMTGQRRKSRRCSDSFLLLTSNKRASIIIRRKSAVLWTK